MCMFWLRSHHWSQNKKERKCLCLAWPVVSLLQLYKIISSRKYSWGLAFCIHLVQVFLMAECQGLECGMPFVTSQSACSVAFQLTWTWPTALIYSSHYNLSLSLSHIGSLLPARWLPCSTAAWLTLLPEVWSVVFLQQKNDIQDNAPQDVGELVHPSLALAASHLWITLLIRRYHIPRVA